MNRRVNRAGDVSAASSVSTGAHQYRVRMRDGVRLATDVYLPDQLRGRVPAVLVRACYGKSSERLGWRSAARTDRGCDCAARPAEAEGEKCPGSRARA